MSMKLSNSPTVNVKVEGPFYSPSRVYAEFLSSRGRGSRRDTRPGPGAVLLIAGPQSYLLASFPIRIFAFNQGGETSKISFKNSEIRAPRCLSRRSVCLPLGS